MSSLWSILTSTIAAESALAAKHDAVPISLLTNWELEFSPIECFMIGNGGVIVIKRSEAMKSFMQR
jgi:hypothetical protein